ncbi:tryptophan-rich sensory protein [Candidatus Peregrinibacteria bacterium]|nr:MAG: tryptophan-rich sensory protein [Candidatus Peregrinibacteria bacterium]
MGKTIKLIASILLCETAGIIGVGFTTSAIPTWYDALNKPSFNPPSWIFGPVWTALYFFMGLSLFLVWINPSKTKQKAFLFFFIQLLLNAIWSPVFFGLRSTSMGLIVIIFLWIFILLTLIHFYKISKPSAALLAPYFLWVSFATVLNFSIWQLNL